MPGHPRPLGEPRVILGLTRRCCLKLNTQEDVHHVGAPPDLLVEPLLGVVRTDGGPCSRGNAVKASSPGTCRRACRSPRRSGAGAGPRPCAGPDLLAVGLLEDGAHQGGHHRLGALGAPWSAGCAWGGCDSADEVPARTASMAPLSPSWASETTSCAPGQSPGDQAAQEGQPARPILGGDHVEAQHLAGPASGRFPRPTVTQCRQSINR